MRTWSTHIILTMAKKKKIDWLNHALEFFVVIIGILIAFQLNECSNAKSESKTIAIHLTEIKQEAELNKYNFKSAIRGAEASLVKIDSLIELIINKEDLKKINKLSLDLLNLSGLYIRRNAYASLIASGDIRLIKDFDVKKRIVNLYEYYAWVELYNQLSYSDYGTNFNPYMVKNFDLINAEVQNETVYYSKVYLNALATYRFTLDNKLKKYKDCLKEIDNYLEANNQ